MAEAVRRGLFLTFEGTEGSGKSTQMRLLAERLRAAGYPVQENQEPGATAIGKQVRRILLDGRNVEMAGMTELLLMFASRAQAAAEIIRPALDRNEIVLSDRFTDSTLAYQGYARGLGFDLVMQAHRLALGSLTPDLTLGIRVDLRTGLARTLERRKADQQVCEETRIDDESLAFHSAVLAGYERIAELEPQRFRYLDGSGTTDEVAERVWREVEPFLNR